MECRTRSLLVTYAAARCALGLFELLAHFSGVPCVSAGALGAVNNALKGLMRPS